MASHPDGELCGSRDNMDKCLAAAANKLENVTLQDETYEAAGPRTSSEFSFSFTTYDSPCFPVSELSDCCSSFSREEQDRVQSAAANGNQPDGNAPGHVSALTKANIQKLNQTQSQDLRLWDGLVPWMPSSDDYSKITDTMPTADLERHKGKMLPKNTTQPEVQRDEDVFTIGGSLSDVSTYGDDYGSNIAKNGPNAGSHRERSKPEKPGQGRQNDTEIIFPPHVGYL